MIPISQQYRDLIYSIALARQFTPEIVMKMLPTNLGNFVASVSSEAFWSKLTEAFDSEIESSGIRYSSMECNNHILDGNTTFLTSRDTPPSSATGWVSDNLSDADCLIDEWLLIEYEQVINSPGRTFFFDDAYIARPTDIDIYYFDENDDLMYTEEIRNILDFTYSTQYGITGYKKILINITKTNLPLSRIRLIEEVPGLYIIYKEKSIVSVTLSESVDIFSETITSSAMSIEIDNQNNPLDILNDEGREKYLQRRQAIDFYLNLIYPDGSKEKISVGTFFLYNWKTNKQLPVAQFNTRDGIDRLFSTLFDKGMHYTVPKSFYELAVEVFVAANVTDYEIDDELLTMYTYGMLPIASFKECLRLIAQATCSIVKRRITGGIHIKYIGIPSTWPAAVDEFDYSILVVPPEVTTDEAVKNITVAIHSRIPDAASSQVYTGKRIIDGEETFTLKYSRSAINCTASVSAGATLIDAVYYTQVAVLTVSTASSIEVSITISGIGLVDSTTPYTVENTIDPVLLVDAEEKSIDNPLVTTNGIAEALAQYTLYWKNRNKLYSFDWRGSPHIELLDAVKVHDDFDKNNTVLITDNDLSYQGGVLSTETSKGRY